MLAELIGALKKMRTLAGGVLIVEPSTGSEPMTKACASAAGGRDSKGDQVNASSKLRLSAEISRGLRKRPCRIKSPHGSGIHSFEIVHQPVHARNICPIKFCRGESGGEWLGGPLWSPASCSLCSPVGERDHTLTTGPPYYYYSPSRAHSQKAKGPRDGIEPTTPAFSVLCSTN